MPTHFPGVPRWDLFILVLLPYTYTLSLKLWSFDKLEQFTKYIPIQDWHRIEWSRFRNASNLRSRLLSSSRNPSLPIMHHADDILGVYTLQFLYHNAPVTFFLSNTRMRHSEPLRGCLYFLTVTRGIHRLSSFDRGRPLFFLKHRHYQRHQLLMSDNPGNADRTIIWSVDLILNRLCWTYWRISVPMAFRKPWIHLRLAIGKG